MPIVSVNDYFTYYKNASGVHRQDKQVWNVGGKAGYIAIVLQGFVGKALAGTVGGDGNTYFAKKHLLTFKGGKAEANLNGGEDAKGGRILQKRTNSDAYDPKYGNHLNLSRNTFVFCDYLTADELQAAFYDALTGAGAANKTFAHCRVNFPRDCVARVDSCGVSSDVKNWISIGFARTASGRYAIMHLQA